MEMAKVVGLGESASLLWDENGIKIKSPGSSNGTFQREREVGAESMSLNTAMIIVELCLTRISRWNRCRDVLTLCYLTDSLI